MDYFHLFYIVSNSLGLTSNTDFDHQSGGGGDEKISIKKYVEKQNLFLILYQHPFTKYMKRKTIFNFICLFT